MDGLRTRRAVSDLGWLEVAWRDLGWVGEEEGMERGWEREAHTEHDTACPHSVGEFWPRHDMRNPAHWVLLRCTTQFLPAELMFLLCCQFSTDTAQASRVLCVSILSGKNVASCTSAFCPCVLSHLSLLCHGATYWHGWQCFATTRRCCVFLLRQGCLNTDLLP